MSAIQRAVVVVIAAAALLAPAAAGAVAPASASTAGTAGPAAGVISTVAGGVGGPARGTKVALLAPCGSVRGGVWCRAPVHRRSRVGAAAESRHWLSAHRGWYRGCA